MTENFTRKTKFSISSKIAATYMRGLIVSLFFCTLIIGGTLFISLIKNEWNKLEKTYSLLTNELKNSKDNDIKAPIYRVLGRQYTDLIIDEAKKEIRIIRSDDEIVFKETSGERLLCIFCRTKNELLLVYERRLSFKNKQYKIMLFGDIFEHVVLILRFLTISVGANLLVILFTVVFGIRHNSRVLKPIKDMTQTVKSISGSNLSLRINTEDVQDELSELAKTINGMMDKIENSYNRQQQFVSDASHELRTPIAVLQGYADMLDRWGKNDPNVLLEAISTIKSETNNMRELVEKLLFLARCDKSTLTFQKEDFDLSELLEEMVKDTEIIVNYHEIIKDIQAGIHIHADRNRIKQAIRVFIDNAVKYTPEYGKIYIGLSKVKGDALISISDTGIGISSEDIFKIFDRFYRSDKSRTKEKGGSGLGLAIAKEIISGHNGKIKVRSKVDEGSEFSIYLSLQYE